MLVCLIIIIIFLKAKDKRRERKYISIQDKVGARSTPTQKKRETNN